MRANELELLRASGVEPCLLMDNGGKTGRLPFSEAALALRPGVDLLINSNFRCPVNQRGLTEYTERGYIIDMWKLTTGGATVTVTSDGLIASKLNATIRHFVENRDLYNGMIYTFSVLMKNSGLISATGQLTEGKTFVITSSISNGGIADSTYDGEIAIIQLSNSDYAVAARLEPGDYQTLAHQDASGSWVLNDPQPNKALELLKCQRYQAVIFRENDISAISISDFAICISSTAATALIHLPTTLRTMPIVKFKKIFLMDLIDGNITYEITSMFVARFSKNVLKLNITCNGGSLTVGAHYFLTKIDDGFLVFDANL